MTEFSDASQPLRSASADIVSAVVESGSMSVHTYAYLVLIYFS